MQKETTMYFCSQVIVNQTHSFIKEIGTGIMQMFVTERHIATMPVDEEILYHPGPTDYCSAQDFRDLTLSSKTQNTKTLLRSGAARLFPPSTTLTRLSPNPRP